MWFKRTIVVCTLMASLPTLTILWISEHLNFYISMLLIAAAFV